MKIYTLDRGTEQHNRIDYATVLNEQQRAAVQHDARAALVLAGPGSGKTRVLVHRVAHLIEQGIKPEQILLLTFTNKAAKEMLRRTEELLGKKPRGLMGGTFHHVGNTLLRRHAAVVDLPSNFSIIDSEDSKQLMKDVIASTFPEQEKHFPSASVIHAILSFGANAQISIKECIEQRFKAYKKHTEAIELISRQYATRKKKSHLVDFDDLLLHWNTILDNEQILGHYRKTWKHVLVDEFQDTNKLQFSIIHKLTEDGGNSIMVVGDDCQSIYSFRAAEIANILEFPKRYDGCKEYRLEENYRSTPEIVTLVNKSIAHNSAQFKKVLKTDNKKGEKPAVVHCLDAEQEASFVGQRILELHSSGIPYKEIGALFRAEYQSAQLELELTRRGIPFIKRGGLRFFEQAHIKDITAFLKVINNEQDELAWKRLVCLFRGIGPSKAISIWSWVSATRDPLRHIKGANMQLMVQAPGWAEFKRVLAELPEGKNPSMLIDYFLHAFYEEYLKEQYANYKERLLDVRQYINLAFQYRDIQKFLEDILLDADLTSTGESDAPVEEDSVVLSTIHQAKGLEWQGVFVLSLADERFPLERAYAEDTLEEERRLFYVACSRARHFLFLTVPMQEFTYWGGNKVLRDSIFIEELSPSCYENWQLAERIEEKTETEKFGWGKDSGFVRADEL